MIEYVFNIDEDYEMCATNSKLNSFPLEMNEIQPKHARFKTL